MIVQTKYFILGELKIDQSDSYMWQSRVEIEHYSIAYFDCITAFEAL